MSARISTRLAAGLGVAVTLALLGGCAYDYLQRTDRVGYKAGNAVKANLQQQVINPTKGSQYVTTGLGKNGAIPTDTAAEEAPAPAAP